MSGLTLDATAYGPPWGGIQGGGTTATGIALPPSVEQTVIPIIAVDPSVIPLHTRLTIWPNPFGDPNLVFQAEDTGGAIKGNRIDFLDLMGRAHQDAWGRRTVTANVVGNGGLSIPAAVPSSSSSTAASSSSQGSSSATSQPSSSSTPSGWLKLLADGAFLVLGGALIYRGAKRSTGGQRG